jgi:outer membrane protein OmpA-like peptidoglycan-associated protein
MKKLTLTLSLVFSLICVQLQAQLLSKADKYFNSFAYGDAVDLYEILWKKDSVNRYITRQLAVSYRMMNNTVKMEKYYSKLVNLTDNESEDYYHYSKALQSNEKYDKAKIYMDKYLAFENAKPRSKIDPRFLMSLRDDSTRYQIAPVLINSEASEFGPAFYKDQLVFSSAKAMPKLIKRNHRWNDQNYLRLYVANINQEDQLLDVKLLSSRLATNYHDGPVCFNKAGDEMFLTRNYVSDSKRAQKDDSGVVSIKLYHCKKEGEHWSSPKLLPFNMDRYSTGHPSLSADGKRLYFISDRPGGFGGTDIYYAERNGESWNEPVNLGNTINTPENEMSPFIANNNSFYFASKGHAGLGGLDIFWIKDLDSDTLINMGYPINTAKDDFSFVLKNGKGYLASNRVKGESYDDIYKFKIVRRLIKGKVYHDETHEILPNSMVKLIDENGKAIQEVYTGADGVFKFLVDAVQNFKLTSEKLMYNIGTGLVGRGELEDQIEVHCDLYQSRDNSLELAGVVLYRGDRSPVSHLDIRLVNMNTGDIVDLVTGDKGNINSPIDRNTEYTIEYHKEGVFAEPGSFSTSNIEGNKLHIEKLVDKVEVGKVFVLENIFYDLDKSEIRPDAALELDKLVMVMNDNPSLKIELSSHTDSRGSDAYNMALSERRAKSAVKYIIENGIAKDRIVAKGYGETKLINHCYNGVECSKAEHQANRRTEVKVLEL